MEAVMQVYILSRHCTIVSMTLAMLMQHQSGRSQCQLQNYWICQLKKKKDGNDGGNDKQLCSLISLQKYSHAPNYHLVY